MLMSNQKYDVNDSSLITVSFQGTNIHILKASHGRSDMTTCFYGGPYWELKTCFSDHTQALVTKYDQMPIGLISVVVVWKETYSKKGLNVYSTELIQVSKWPIKATHFTAN